MASRKRTKRIAETNAELEDSLETRNKESLVQKRADEGSLFVVDRLGSKNARRRIAKEIVAVESGKVVSLVEQKLIRKIQEQKKPTLAQKRQEALQHKSLQLADLWGDDVDGKASAADAEAAELGVRRKKRVASTLGKPLVSNGGKVLKVAGPGFSYNPSQDAHQDVIAEALAIELKKREKEAKEKKGGSVGEARLSVLSLALSQDDDGDDDEDDEEEEDNDDDEEDGEGGKEKKSSRLKEKKTRAQRNKIRAKRLASHKQSIEQTEKNILKQIDKLPHLLRSVEEEAKKKEALAKIKELRKSSSADETALTYVDAGTVPLSDELRGSLRTITPKGCALALAMNGMKETGVVLGKSRRTRKKGENPLTGPKVKWVAKHKYPQI